MHAVTQSRPETGLPFGAKMLLSLAVVLAMGFAGCTRMRPVAESQSPQQIVWPGPPEVARVAFVKSIGRPADLGIKTSAFKRFGRWIIGSDKGNESLMKPFAVAL